MLTNFVWKTAFTFNIDDTLESAYQTNSKRKQNPEPINYDSEYRVTFSPSNVPIIHLHGFVREPEKGYVFSIAEYARVTRGLNPWMHVLSELLASEPFIISGTSLNESDLEYYLSGRTQTSPRANRGPSILVEPFPDAVTENDCLRHGLVLAKGTLTEFLDWINKKIGEPPTVAELTIPPIEKIFFPKPTNLEQIAFFSAFELIRPLDYSAEDRTLSPFYYGRAPTWPDLAAFVDVPTDDELRLSAKVRAFLDTTSSQKSLYCVLAEPGTGKTTNIRRVGYDLAREGRIVLSMIGRSAIDIENTVACLSLVVKPYVLLIDRAADHAPLIQSIITHPQLSIPFLVLAAERHYRRDHLDRLLGDLDVEYFSINIWPDNALLQLVEKYRRNGLLGAEGAIRAPEKFALSLRRDPVAIATCRILNDFRPIESIVKSIWNHADASLRRSYIVAALAYYCHPVGLLYSILEASHKNPNLVNQFSYNNPLPLAYSADDDDYVIPLNPMIADRALIILSREKQSIFLDIFVKLGNALAPYVNRRTIIAQTPEARLAGRLFHAEKVVRPLLGGLSEEFYKATKSSWEWNSRYWEQRALLMQTTDIDTAIQFARHAVAIEAHPFPWTTLASLLFKKLETQPLLRDSLYKEANELLAKAFYREDEHDWRPTPHPYATLIRGTISFLELNGTLSPRQRELIKSKVLKAQACFSRDARVGEASEKLLERLSLKA